MARIVVLENTKRRDIAKRSRQRQTTCKVEGKNRSVQLDTPTS